MIKGAVVGIAGSAALGAAARLANRRHPRPQVVGISIPEELMPRNLDPKKLMPRNLDLKKLIPENLDPKELTQNLDLKRVIDDLDLTELVKRIGDIAEQIEKRSDEIRILSGKAKRLSRELS